MGYNPKDVWAVSRIHAEREDHPTQKPLEIIEQYYDIIAKRAEKAKTDCESVLDFTAPPAISGSQYPEPVPQQATLFEKRPNKPLHENEKIET